MSKKTYEIDMCNGPLFGKILLFSIPLILSGILQLLFNAADMIVAGRYAGGQALAAIGSTSSLINLMVNVFIGLSVGANVLVSHYCGAGRNDDVSETVHTSILLSIICGFLLCMTGIFLTEPLLSLMGTPGDVLGQSSVYMQIYFCGMPAMLLFNFGSSILRAIGDTKRPLYFLLAAGVMNVCMNLIFVIFLHLDVAGVALATVISQYMSAALIVRCLMQNTGVCHLELSRLRIHRGKMVRILRIGLPAGLQSAVFSFSNVLIQSSVNSFGSIAMAGNTASQSLEGFVYTSMNAFHQTVLSFISQNAGARKFDRIPKILITCLVMVTFVGGGMGVLGILFGKQILSIYSSDPEVIAFGLARLTIIFATYFTCGIMDVQSGAIRGMGYSVMPMIVSLLGACGLRIIWIFTIFSWHRDLRTLYIAYPVSWTVTALVHIVCFLIVYRKLKMKNQKTKSPA